MAPPTRVPRARYVTSIEIIPSHSLPWVGTNEAMVQEMMDAATQQSVME